MVWFLLVWHSKPSCIISIPPQEPLCKPVALSARKAGGAFQPFERQKRAEAPASSATTAAASSAAAVVGDSSDGAPVDTDAAERRPRSDDKETSGDAKDKGSGKKGSKGGEEGQSQAQAPARKPRRCWAPELHRRFLQALQQLGGSHGRCATRTEGSNRIIQQARPSS